MVLCVQLYLRTHAIFAGVWLGAALLVGAAGCKPKAADAPTSPVAQGLAPAAGKTPGPGSGEESKSGKLDAKAAAQKANAEKDRARQAAAEAVPVEVALIARGPISAFLSYNSTLETEAAVDLYPQTGGQVEALLVEEGHVVKRGDPLLKIEDRELRVDVEESSSHYEHLQKAYARVEDLYKRNLINKQEYEDNRYQLEQARLKDQRAKLRLAYATVEAPFDGIISSRDTQVGARVTSGTKLFSMVKLDEIVARVFVPGRYLAVVRQDQPAVITSEFLPNRAFKGQVKRISPVIDPKSGTFKVTVAVKGDQPTDLPPGLFVGVRIMTDTRTDALLVPKRAIVYEGGERYVFVLLNGKAVKRRLVGGFEDPLNVEALSGLEVGASVVVLGHAGLKEGTMIRVVNPASPVSADPAGRPAGAPTRTVQAEMPAKK